MAENRFTIHFVERTGVTVSPLCGGWSGGTSWTLHERIASCPECVARLAAQAEVRSAHVVVTGERKASIRESLAD